MNGLFIFKNSVFFCKNVAMLRCCLLRFAPIFGGFYVVPLSFALSKAHKIT